MRTVLVVGGYGAVGRVAAGALAAEPNTRVIVAGRNPGKARPVPATTTRTLDVADPADLAAALQGVHTVLMCAETENRRVARACIERGIQYVDVSASYPVLAEIESLDAVARQCGATAALSVGLVPGISNLLARICLDRSDGHDLRIGVLLGIGDQHGPKAVSWTIDGLARAGEKWTMTFPPPHGTRTVYRFPFSDQYTLTSSLGVASAKTGLCLDSRTATTLLAVARQPAVARLLGGRPVRTVLLPLLERLRVGGDEFSVTVECGDVHASFSGRHQSRATGLAAARLVMELDGRPAGVRHIEHLVDPEPFLNRLAKDNFDVSVRHFTGRNE